MTDEHQPGRCLCVACHIRARRLAPTVYGFLGKLSGEPAAFRQAFAWCPWCANWHRHGDDGSTAGDVLHRREHCSSAASPYRPYGYLIAVTNVPLALVYRQMRKASDEQLVEIRDGRTSPAIEKLRAQVLPMLRADHHVAGPGVGLASER